MVKDIATEPEILNYAMDEEFKWSEDHTIVRDAIWDYLMEANGRDTIKTEHAMKPFLDMTEAQVRDYVEAHLQK